MKNIVLIILLLFTTNLIAQREYGDPAKYPYSTIIPDNSTVQFRINGKTMIVNWLTVKNIVGANSTLLNSQNTWTQLNSFNQAVQLASSPTVSLQRGFSFSGNKPAYSINGETFVLANMNDLADAGLGSGTGYARTDATNNFSATQNFNAGASIADGQKFKLGRSTSPLTIGNYGFVLSNLGGYVNYSWVDANNDKGVDTLATLRKLRQLGVGTTSGQYALTNATQTGFQSAWTWTSGSSYGILFGDGNQLGVPYFSNINNIQSYRLGWTGSGILYFGYNKIMNESDVDDKVSDVLSYQYPATVTAIIDTLTFRDNNYIAARYTVPGNTTIYVSNSSPGWVSFCVNGTLNTVTISAKNGIGASTWGTIKWSNGNAPNFSNTYAVYQINLQRLDATTILASWVFHQ